MIGQKINEFDNSIGTVKKFNEIFDLTPLTSSRGKNLANGEVEIGGIVGIGQETVRLVTLNVDGTERTFEHDFKPKTGSEREVVIVQTEQKKAKLRRYMLNQKPRYKYTVKKNGKDPKVFFNIVDVAKHIGVNKCIVSQYTSGRWKNKEGYTVKKEDNK